MGFDRSEFHALFYQECARCLTELDEAVAALVPDEPDDELLTLAYRMVHTIGGDAAIVGFEGIASFSQRIEELFRVLRAHDVALSTEVIDALGEASAVLRTVIDRQQSGEAPDGERVAGAEERLAALSGEAGGRAG